MTRDQWIAIFDKDQGEYGTALFSSLNICNRVVYLHSQKDRLLEQIVQVQRTNIRKLIDQQELNLSDDFFKNSDRRVGSGRNS